MEGDEASIRNILEDCENEAKFIWNVNAHDA